MLFFWLSFLGLVGADQLSKWAVQIILAPGESISLVPGILWLTHARNAGAAFSLFPGQPVLLVVTTLVLIAVGIGFRQRLCVLGFGPALVFILAGAVGNLIDRLRFGEVIDFLDLRFWPVFNLADVSITVGAGMIILMVLRGSRAGDKGS